MHPHDTASASSEEAGRRNSTATHNAPTVANRSTHKSLKARSSFRAHLPIFSLIALPIFHAVCRNGQADIDTLLLLLGQFRRRIDILIIIIDDRRQLLRSIYISLSCYIRLSTLSFFRAAAHDRLPVHSRLRCICRLASALTGRELRQGCFNGKALEKQRCKWDLVAIYY